MATNNTINLAAASRSIIVEQGASIVVPFNCTRQQLPLDLSGYTLNMQVRRTFADTKVLINCTTANDRLQWVSQSDGRFKLVLKPDATVDGALIKFTVDELSNGSIDAIYDLEITNLVDGTVYKGVKGNFTILREVTRV